MKKVLLELDISVDDLYIFQSIMFIPKIDLVRELTLWIFTKIEFKAVHMACISCVWRTVLTSTILLSVQWLWP